MAVDIRQVLAGIITVTMFVKLGNMIKHDHFDAPAVPNNIDRALEHGLASVTKGTDAQWKDDGSTLKQSWEKSVSSLDETRGHPFSSKNGPDYHVSDTTLVHAAMDKDGAKETRQQKEEMLALFHKRVMFRMQEAKA